MANQGFINVRIGFSTPDTMAPTLVALTVQLQDLGFKVYHQAYPVVKDLDIPLIAIVPEKYNG